MSDDEPRRAPQRLTILPLDTLGVGELEDYIADLRSEIARAEAALARRRSVRLDADAVFRRPGGTDVRACVSTRGAAALDARGSPLEP